LSDTPTPGQLAYEAYNAAYDTEMVWGDHGWFALPIMTQRAWEAAAQAVLAQCTPQEDPPCADA